MAVTRLMHFLQESGICRNKKSHKQLKSSITRNKSHLSIDHVSLPSSDHNLLAQKLSDCIKRPISSNRYKCNILQCHSSLLPNITTPWMKTATETITGPKPTTYLHSSLYIPKLVMAVGVVVFVLWGLEPLVRTIRNVSLHKDDNSWKRCTTRRILISYIQPLLLWAATMLVCRTLEPVVMPTKASRLVKERFITAVQQANKVFVETTEHSDAGRMGFHLAEKAVNTSVWIAAISLFMELLGFSTKKWLTAGGLGTVLLTLAGREIFTNFLSSAIIQATRPFVVNEWIQTNIQGYEVSGVVEDVRWWSPTLIRGEDREAVYIPNHMFTMNIVRNLSQKTHWRIRASLAVSHLDNIVADMRKVLAKNPQVEQQKLHRRVFFENVDPVNQALTIAVSCFVKTSHQEEYLCVKEAILLDLLRVIKHHRARLATPIRSIQKHYSDANMDDIPSSESVGSREENPNRVLLLIDPSYEINGGPDSHARSQDSTAARTKETSKSSTKVREVDVNSSSKLDNKSKHIEMPRPAMEENIVLEVALDGLKRSLPLEPKELASNRNSNEKGDATPTIKKVDKDNL
ncbi:hypothetical protein V2J09_021740 [Rumex salicifolius]